MHQKFLLWTTAMLVLAQTGCSEGILWRTGYLSPWARQKWADEEQIAPTLFTKREKLREMTRSVEGTDSGNQERVSQVLADVVRKDPIVLMRIEATELLANLRTKTATNALQAATNDPNQQVRLAAVRAWEMRGDEIAIDMLGKLVASDGDLDVRLAATRALGSFKNPLAAKALNAAISDPNPALQIRSARSLEKITGQKLGDDVQAWQRYVNDTFGVAKTQTAGTKNLGDLLDNR